jgi:amino acid adenylation domain-containing protein
MNSLSHAGSQSSAPETVPDLLREHVRLRPDDVAVVDGNSRITFQELLRRGEEIAFHIDHLGLPVDDCIGLFVSPSTDLIIGAWGILLAGGAYLPLSPEYPDQRLRYMIEDSGMKVIVAQEELVRRLTALVPDDTMIVTLGSTAGFGPAAAVPAAENLAYVIYTSGSTGKPKGVLIEHRSIVNQLRWLSVTHGLGPGKTVLHKTPMSFDAAQWEILAPACGATVVVGDAGIHRNPEQIIDTVKAHGVTTLQCVPTLLQALLDTDELQTCESLRQIFTGGEALARPLAQACVDTLPWCELINLYGPTECTINSSAFVVNPATVGDGPNAVSIGTPVAETDYHILSADLTEVVVGEIGELYIGGIQVGRGYLHRPRLTAERFVNNPFGAGRLFRTGDLAYWNADGTVQFVGRADNQVKLRGFRVELDEIRLAIETHDWVKHAAVFVKKNSRGYQNLVACVELNPKEAALMDQGNHAAHHQSKESKLQVKAQLSNAGTRDPAEDSGKLAIDLPGRTATQAQRRQAFARKTYRFYDGGQVTRADILKLLAQRHIQASPRNLEQIPFTEFAEILRYFGQHLSPNRLLPKYGYASPGSLYATQLYLEVHGIGDLRPGIYYYHPVDHRVVLITATTDAAGYRSRSRLKLHFSGKKRAIEPVYKNNIREVLEIETGHMIGLFEEILPHYGLDIVGREFTPEIKVALDVAAEDYYLGTFELVPYTGSRSEEPMDVYVQAHPAKVADMLAGQYAYQGGELELISSELILRKHVIAINQAVYDRASFGISLISRTKHRWRQYIELGRKLQHLSMNDLDLGFMSSGYSSKSGYDLPSARRIDAILDSVGRRGGPSYFFVGGRVSEEQRLHEGMKEDIVHTRGPAELIRDDLINVLPDYMIPNRVILMDELPTTANGKIDVKALAASEAIDIDAYRPFVAPRSAVERKIAELWKAAMKRETASVHDDFFSSGGDSMIAVGLVHRINGEFGSSLPLQVLFESPTIEELARRVATGLKEASRLVVLQPDGSSDPIYCWPGLGGYTMNLRPLARKLGPDRPFVGVQARGINAGEVPCRTIREMAAADVDLIRQRQQQGPYTLWGYSFGARVAFEAAYQLEQLGEQVEHVFLIAPGSPLVDSPQGSTHIADYTDPAYVTILFSVFSGTTSGPLLDECLATAKDDESLAAFIGQHFPDLDIDPVRRIIDIAATTFEFSYTFQELNERRIDAPITIFKAQGDDYSFLEGSSGFSSSPPTVVTLTADHYSMLRDPDIDELVTAIRQRLTAERDRSCHTSASSISQ